MVILLDGTSAMGRTTIAEQITSVLPAWKHLSLEVIQNGIRGDSPEYHAQHAEIVHRCAEELEKDGMHLILSMPESPEHFTLMKNSLGRSCVAIHIGEGDEEGYDFTFDSSVSSVKDIVAFLEKLIDRLAHERHD